MEKSLRWTKQDDRSVTAISILSGFQATLLDIFAMLTLDVLSSICSASNIILVLTFTFR